MKSLSNKKRKWMWCVACVLVFSASITAFAQVTILDRISSNTYVSSEHAGGLSDTYYGKLSILGTDRAKSGIVWKYPYACRITYNVQGDITQEQIFSKGEKDSVVRTKNVTVKDKWNFGDKTTVQGYITLSNVTGESVSSIEDIER